MTEEEKNLPEGKRKERKRKIAEWGKMAENITKDYLTQKGHPVTEQNWRCGNRLELDLISQQGDEMVFIEVKARDGYYNHAEDAIDEKKIKQIVKAANAYLQTREKYYTARFDVALVEGSPSEYEFTYIENAFVPPLNAR